MMGRPFAFSWVTIAALSAHTTLAAQQEPDPVQFQRVAEVLGEAAAAELSPAIIKQLDEMRTNAENGGEPLWVCTTPDADPSLHSALEIFNRLQMAIYTQNPANENPDAQSRFQPSQRWSTTATNGGGLNIGEPITITYSFVPDGTSTTNGPSDLFAAFDAFYAGRSYTGTDGITRFGRDAWQQVFKDAIESWGEVSNINYVFEPNDDGATFRQFGGQLGVRGDVRIAGAFIDGSGGPGGSVLANNSFPNNGDMLMDSADPFYADTSNNSLGLFNVVAHEHGHGQGISHTCPVDGLTLMEPFINESFIGVQLDDRLSSQALYGDRFEPNSGGLFSPGTQLGSITRGERIDLEALSIHDNNDTDTFFLTVTGEGPTTLEVFMAPDGNAYNEGPQNFDGSCSAGSLIVFEDVADISLEIRELGAVFATANASVAGHPESLVADLPGPGTYEIRVNGSAANPISIQPYALEILAYETSVDSIIYEETFESAATDWTVTNSAGLTDGQWEVGSPVTLFGRSAPHHDVDGNTTAALAFLTANDATGSNSDVDGGSSTATSPAFDFTGGGFIRYAYWIDDRINEIGPEDFLRLEYSNNNGATWFILETFNEGKPRWQRSIAEVTAEDASDQFRIRFVVADNDPGDVLEAAFDSITVFPAPATGPMACSIADLDANGAIDVFDLIAFLQNFNPSATCPADPECALADIDNNNAIDVFDLITFLQAFDPNDPNCQSAM